MILELDIGNTRIKWRLLAGQGKAEFAAGVETDLQSLTVELLGGATVSRVRASCVRPQALTDSIQNWSRKNWQLPAELAQVKRSCGGVTVQYEDVSRLGVDRWLAMLAAFEAADSSCMVVDCGTALTIDLLDKSGVHQGGYIVPGLVLGPKSLLANTEIRVSDITRIHAEDPGNSTEAAIFNGNLLMLRSFIERVAAALKSHSDGAAVVFFTGGDAELFASRVDLSGADIVPIPTLVMDGLAIALP